MFFRNLFLYLFWIFHDLVLACRSGRQHRFKEYGLTMFCGRQGGGKTVSMTEYLERMRSLYPGVLIYTNYGYAHQNGPLKGWNMLLHTRSDHGVIFAIDEIHSEFSSNAWKDFPPELLRQVSQQRKQQVKIVCTAQCYKDVAVQLRRQCFDVIECKTLGGRWTFQRCFDAEDYNAYVDSNSTPEKKFKIHRKWRRSFVQTDKLRTLFDSYAVIQAMEKSGFQQRPPLNV